MKNSKLKLSEYMQNKSRSKSFSKSVFIVRVPKNKTDCLQLIVSQILTFSMSVFGFNNTDQVVSQRYAKQKSQNGQKHLYWCMYNFHIFII